MGGMMGINVLFVCMGNICRSPTAHAVLEKMVADAQLTSEISIDSAGTHAYHVGNPPDSRAQTVATQRGYNLGDQKARRVVPSDFETYDYIFAMDRDIMQNLLGKCPDKSEYAVKVKLYLEFTRNRRIKDVPDPYYGGIVGFERVLDIVEEASQNLLQTLRSRYGL